MQYFSHETACIDTGAQIGEDTRIWHFSHISSKAIIGSRCSLGQNVFIADKVVIGSNVKIQNNVSLYEGVIIEDDVFCGPSMVFTNVINPRAPIERKSEYRPTVVKRGATIGANATIICGNEIGEYAFIAAGSVVTHPVQAYALVMGSPARQVGWMSQYGERIKFDEEENGQWQCPHSGLL